MTSGSEAFAQRQLDACNARDLEREVTERGISEAWLINSTCRWRVSGQGMRPSPSIERKPCDAAIARIAVPAFVVIAATASNAAGWDSQPALSDSVVVESLGPPTLLPGATGAWVLYSPTLSADCSPPSGRYAKSQRIHYDFSCAPRYAVLTERISMDLNGAIIKHEVRGATSGYTPEYDAAAVRVMETFCPPPDRD